VVSLKLSLNQENDLLTSQSVVEHSKNIKSSVELQEIFYMDEFDLKNQFINNPLFLATKLTKAY
jgi:hypothetical protein